MQSMQNLRQIWKVQSWTNTIKRWNMPKARNSSEEGEVRKDSVKRDWYFWNNNGRMKKISAWEETVCQDGKK